MRSFYSTRIKQGMVPTRDGKVDVARLIELSPPADVCKELPVLLKKQICLDQQHDRERAPLVTEETDLVEKLKVVRCRIGDIDAKHASRSLESKIYSLAQPLVQKMLQPEAQQWCGMLMGAEGIVAIYAAGRRIEKEINLLDGEETRHACWVNIFELLGVYIPSTFKKAAQMEGAKSLGDFIQACRAGEVVARRLPMHPYALQEGGAYRKWVCIKYHGPWKWNFLMADKTLKPVDPEDHELWDYKAPDTESDDDDIYFDSK